MDWVVIAITAAALGLIALFWRFMSRVEYRESLSGEGVPGFSVSASHSGSTVSATVTNTSRHAVTARVFVVVHTERGWFESTRKNEPVSERMNPDTPTASEWHFPDIGDDIIERVDVYVSAPYEPYRIALRQPAEQRELEPSWT